MSRPCTATCRNGDPCRAWAMHGTDPPRCASHGGSKAPPGAPLGNTNALKHGYYAQTDLPDDASIDDIIARLYQQQLELETYIAHVKSTNTASILELTHLLQLYGQNASRLGRLLRDQRALSGDTADGISAAIGKALDELGSEWGIDI